MGKNVTLTGLLKRCDEGVLGHGKKGALKKAPSTHPEQFHF
jgi:hypothetical protein